MYYLQDRSVVIGAFLNKVVEYNLAKKKLQIEIDYDSDELCLRDKCAEIPYGKPGHPSAAELSVVLAEQQLCSKDAACRVDLSTKCGSPALAYTASQQVDLEAEPDVDAGELDKRYRVCSIYAKVSVGSTGFVVNEMVLDTATTFNIIDENFFRLLRNKVGDKLCFVRYGKRKELPASELVARPSGTCLGRPILLGTPGLDLLNIVPDVRNKLCTYDTDVGETELTPMKTTIDGTTREWPCAEALLDLHTAARLAQTVKHVRMRLELSGVARIPYLLLRASCMRSGLALPNQVSELHEDGTLLCPVANLSDTEIRLASKSPLGCCEHLGFDVTGLQVPEKVIQGHKLAGRLKK
ncbi:hypothetical protein HDU89_001920 [Geranomyces variabilis]|nr:hypothetical protein HDU89_001920 [Geranomyces variabilis]